MNRIDIIIGFITAVLFVLSLSWQQKTWTQFTIKVIITFMYIVSFAYFMISTGLIK